MISVLTVAAWQAVEEKAAHALEAGAAKHMQEADFEALGYGWIWIGYGTYFANILGRWPGGIRSLDERICRHTVIQSYSRLFCLRSRLQLACGRWQSECEKASMPRRTFLSACCEEPEVYYLDIERYRIWDTVYIYIEIDRYRLMDIDIDIDRETEIERQR